jgi:hypothetical protein
LASWLQARPGKHCSILLTFLRRRCEVAIRFQAPSCGLIFVFIKWRTRLDMVPHHSVIHTRFDVATRSRDSGKDNRSANWMNVHIFARSHYCFLLCFFGCYQSTDELITICVSKII